MFESHKPIYMTKAVAGELSKEHQIFLVRYLLKNQGRLTDYLQIFEFYVENNEQWLIQRQEEPNQETALFVKLAKSEPIERKVWAIDQGEEGVIILFPEDY